ncbi:MAG: hypothetical protein ACJAVY_002162, partial [Marinoscillum sp.]
MFKKLIFIACSLLSGLAYAQVITVSGKVTESASGTPIPFANVVFLGTQEGAIT